MIRVIRHKLAEEIFFVVAASLAVVTTLLVGARAAAIDWHVIVALFVLMGLTLTFEKYHLLDALSRGLLSLCGTSRQLSLTLTWLTAFLALWVTNDVALITLVPLTLVIAKRTAFKPLHTIIAQTMAANIGSSLTPFGNPQNLYLYNYYQLAPLQFILTTAPFVLGGMLLVTLYLMLQKSEPLKPGLAAIVLKHKPRLALYIALFLFVILGILRLLPFTLVAGLAALVLIVLEGKLLLKVDYFLLGTFIACFIAIDNLTRLPQLQEAILPLLTTPLQVLITAMLSSQIISNVPTAVLLSGFTAATHAPALLLGVSLGGLGTLVASLANLISYKYYIAFDAKSPYKRYFMAVNSLILIILLPLVALLAS